MNSLSKIAATFGAMSAAAVIGSVSANADSVKVQSGDTLSKIAQDHNTTVDNLVALNNIQNRNLIFVDEEIQLDGTAAATTSTASTASTTTQAATSTPAAATTTTTTTAPAAAATAAPSTNTTATASSNAATTSSSLQALINRESSGNVNARNGQYYGIGQLSEAARARYGGNSTDYNDQLQAMKAYIADRYGNADNAWAHSQQTGWY